MDRALKWFIRIWVGLVIGLNLIAIVGMALASHSLWEAWGRITTVYSPFNLINFALEVAVLSPAIAAAIWLERREKRHLP